MTLKANAFGAGVIVLVVLPFVIGDFRTVQLATVGAYFIAILGLDVLTGHSGQISLGHGAFMAVGGYTTAILMSQHGVRDLLTIPIAAGVAGGIGLLAGVPALRLSGLYLALATFGISATFAGVAGALYAINVAYVSPDTFPIQLSLYLLVGAVVGFFGSIWGALLGALLIQFLADLVGLIPHVDTKQGGPTTLFFGLLLVVLMLVLPLVLRVASRFANRGYLGAR